MNGTKIQNSPLRRPKPIRASPSFCNEHPRPAPITRAGSAVLPDETESPFSTPSKKLSSFFAKPNYNKQIIEIITIQNELEMNSLRNSNFRENNEKTKFIVDDLYRPENPMIKDKLWNENEECFKCNTDCDSDEDS